jgi:hypothetical protein
MHLPSTRLTLRNDGPAAPLSIAARFDALTHPRDAHAEMDARGPNTATAVAASFDASPDLLASIRPRQSHAPAHARPPPSSPQRATVTSLSIPTRALNCPFPPTSYIWLLATPTFPHLFHQRFSTSPFPPLPDPPPGWIARSRGHARCSSRRTRRPASASPTGEPLACLTGSV